MILSLYQNYYIFIFIIYMILIFLSFLIVYNKNFLNTIIINSIFSMLLVIAYIFLDAPDVAMTEAAINASLSTVIMLIVYTKIKQNNQIILLKKNSDHSFKLLGLKLNLVVFVAALNVSLLDESL